MKILLVNKFHYLKGGSEKYYFDLAKLLEENGNEVAFFSMKDEKNIKTNCKEFFVESSDMNSKNPFKAFEIISSKRNKKIMENALEDFKPDVVHLNNFQRQLSASIIEPIEKRNIPIIFTAHDLQAICPSIVMLDSEKNICEKCIKGRYMNCIKNNCVKDSKLKSILGAIEGFYYRNKKIYSSKINKILAPSDFFRQMLIKDGIQPEKIATLHNFIDLQQYDKEIEDNGYALYFGRLSKEKGIFNLLKAIKKVNGKLYLAGDGPDREKIEKYIRENNLLDKVILLGYLNENDIREYIRKSRFIVIPSICRENCPYSILETMAIGKPIIGSATGGTLELVKNKETGYLVSNVEELSDKMDFLFKHQEEAEVLGKRAKKIAKEKFSKESYYKKIIKIYEGEIEKCQKKN